MIIILLDEANNNFGFRSHCLYGRHVDEKQIFLLHGMLLSIISLFFSSSCQKTRAIDIYATSFYNLAHADRNFVLKNPGNYLNFIDSVKVMIDLIR